MACLVSNNFQCLIMQVVLLLFGLTVYMLHWYQHLPYFDEAPWLPRGAKRQVLVMNCQKWLYASLLLNAT